MEEIDVSSGTLVDREKIVLEKVTVRLTIDVNDVAGLPLYHCTCLNAGKEVYGTWVLFEIEPRKKRWVYIINGLAPRSLPNLRLMLSKLSAFALFGSSLDFKSGIFVSKITIMPTLLSTKIHFIPRVEKAQVFIIPFASKITSRKETISAAKELIIAPWDYIWMAYDGVDWSIKEAFDASCILGQISFTHGISNAVCSHFEIAGYNFSNYIPVDLISQKIDFGTTLNFDTEIAKLRNETSWDYFAIGIRGIDGSGRFRLATDIASSHGLTLLIISPLELFSVGEKYLLELEALRPRAVIFSNLSRSQERHECRELSIKLFRNFLTVLNNCIVFATFDSSLPILEQRSLFDIIIDSDSNFERKKEYEDIKSHQASVVKFDPEFESGAFLYDDICGLDYVKEEIKVLFEDPIHSNRALFMLFCGPPGTGKTFLARAMALKYNMAFIQVRGPELISMYIGESEANIRKLFEDAKRLSPVLILLDEIDSFATHRGRTGDASGVSDRLVAQLAICLDKICTSGHLRDICIVGTTNRVDLIDSSLLRHGRFENCFEFKGRISKQDTMSIIMSYLRKYPHVHASPDAFLKCLGEHISPANIDEVWRKACKSAIRRLIKNEGSTYTICDEDFQ